MTAGVTESLRKVTSYAANHEARFLKQIAAQNEAGGRRRHNAMQKQLTEMESRIADLHKIIKRLYEDNVTGKLTDERFSILSGEYEAEQKELKDKVLSLQTELDRAKEASAGAEKFMGIVKRHLNFEELTHTLLRELVEKIVVYEAEETDGTRHQNIDIYYSFIGKVDLPEE